MKIAIVGDGGWGTALGLVLLGNGHKVTLWGPFPEYIEQMRATRANALYLPGVKLPDGLGLTADRAEAVKGAEIVVLAVPTKFFRQVMQSFAGLMPRDAALVSVAKGFDPATRERMTSVAESVLGAGPVAALSGPSHAEEVAREVPTAVVIACADQDRAALLQRVFLSARFRAYTAADVAGVEMGGALKNVIAIGVGVSDGVGFGDNTRAALMTRGLAEIMRLGCAYGAQAATFAGLSGMGDMIVTCTSRLSRNRGVGERLGRGETIAQILGSMKQVAEGVTNCVTARELARARGIEVPITDEVHAVIYEGKAPLDALASLMMRSAKAER